MNLISQKWTLILQMKSLKGLLHCGDLIISLTLAFMMHGCFRIGFKHCYVSFLSEVRVGLRRILIDSLKVNHRIHLRRIGLNKRTELILIYGINHR